MRKVNRAMVSVALSLLLAIGWVVPAKAMPDHDGSAGFWGGYFYCSAYMDVWDYEGFGGRIITIYLWGPNNEGLGADAVGQGDPGIGLQLTIGAPVIGPGTYRCQVVYETVIDDPPAWENDDVSYYASY